MNKEILIPTEWADVTLGEFINLSKLDIKDYKTRYVFALKTQQLYTSIEDMLKQIAKSFENHIELANRAPLVTTSSQH